MSDETFRDRDESLHYAMARYTCQWLDERGKLWPFYQAWRDERGKLWPFYQAWRDGVQDDSSGEKAFERIVGKTPADANAEWDRWLRAL